MSAFGFEGRLSVITTVSKSSFSSARKVGGGPQIEIINELDSGKNKCIIGFERWGAGGRGEEISQLPGRAHKSSTNQLSGRLKVGEHFD